MPRSHRIAAAAGGLGIVAAPAYAHIKWFAAFDLSSPPHLPFELFLQIEFVLLAVLAAAAICGAAMLDIHLLGSRWIRRLLLPTARWIDVHAGDLLRYGMSICLVGTVVLFWENPVYLTPDLSTNARWVSVLQLAAAATLLQRAAAWYGGVALLALYTVAGMERSWFHMADYPIFIGIALALVMNASSHSALRKGSLVALRCSIALTFMWGAIEKFTFPEWSYPILAEHPELLFGFSPQFWMLAAGWVEFCLAFALLAFRVGAQVAAGLLLAVCLAAVPLFGWIDAVGHAPFIVVLVILAATPRNSLAPPGNWTTRLVTHGSTIAVMMMFTWGSLFMFYVGAHGASMPSVGFTKRLRQEAVRHAHPNGHAPGPMSGWPTSGVDDHGARSSFLPTFATP